MRNAHAHDGPNGREERQHDRLRTLLDRPIPADELAEQTRLVSEPAERAMEQPTSLLFMRLGRERLAVPAAAVSRVARLTATRRIPHRQAPVVAGLCAVDGRLVLAAHLDRLLGLADAPADVPGARFVVLEDGRGPWAVRVDEVEGVRTEDAASFVEPPPTLGRNIDHFTRAILPLQDGAVAVLDEEAILSALARSLS